MSSERDPARRAESPAEVAAREGLSRPSGDDHPAGQRNTDAGQLEGMQEANPAVFHSPAPSVLRVEDESRMGEPEPGQEMWMGDSRPDSPEGGGFESVAEHPMMTTLRDPADQPEIRKVPAEELEESRVDREDEWVARPTGLAGEEEAILQPGSSRGGDTGEQL